MTGPTLATLGIKVENGEVVKATTALNSMTVAGAKTEASTQRLTRRMALLEIQAREMDAALGQTTKRASSLDSTIAQLAAGFTAFKAVQYARDALGLADAYTNLHSRIALVTTGGENLARIQRELFAVSQSTRTGLESNVALYSSLARSTKALGLSQQEIVGITQTVAQSFLVSGANASETSAAVRQLGQAMASGVLRGDEFNSIAENAPRLQQAVAESLGVTIGQLRAMAAQGELTSRVLAEAMLKSAKAISDEFAKMPLTVGGALTQARNAMLLYVGTTSQASGISETLAGAISGLSKHIGTLVTGAELLATVFIGRVVAGFAKTAAAGMDSVSVMGASLTAQREMAAAAVATAKQQTASSSAVVSALRAEEAEILRLIALEKERQVAAAANAARAAVFPVTPINTGSTGSASSYYAQKELESQRAKAIVLRTAALEAEAVALTNVTALEQRHAQVLAQVSATEARVAETTTATTLAVARQGEVMLATSLATRAWAGATSALSGAMALLGGPIGVALIAATAFNAALDWYIDRTMKAAEQTDAQRQATESALDTAHKHAAATKATADAATEAQRKFAALQQERTEELGKLAALNAAYGQSDLALQLIGLRYDAMLQKSKDAKEHKGAELAALNALTDGILRQKEAQALLADQRERETRLRGTQRGNSDAVRAAQQELELAKLSDDAAARRKIDLAAENALYAARLDFAEKTIRATEAQVATAQQEYDSTVQRVTAVRDLERATLDETDAQKLANDARAIAIQQFNEQGTAAQRAYQAALDATVRTFNEEEKSRDDMHKAWLRGIEHITAHGLTSYRSFFESVYSLFTEMMVKMKKDGEASGFGYGALKTGSAALAGGFAGYGVGQSAYSDAHGGAGNAARGALGGAAAGALAGSAFGPVGSAVGAVAGFTMGIIGAGKAAKEAAARMGDLQKALAASIAGIRAELAGDSLGAALASEKAKFDALRKQTEDAYAGGGSGSAQVAKRNAVLADLNGLEARRIAQLQAEAEAVRRAAQEDLHVRLLTAQGHTAEAHARAFALAQQREMAAALKDTTASGIAYANALGVVLTAEKDAREAAIKKDEIEAARVSIVSDTIRQLTAEGKTWDAQQMEMAENHRRGMEALIKSMGDTIDPIAITARIAADAAEDARAAWQHTQDVINQGTDWIAQQADVFGMNPSDAFAMETQNFGFGGMTKEEVRALFTPWTLGGQLTPEQKAMNDHVSQWIRDFERINAASTGGAAGGRASAAGAMQALSSVSSSVNQQTALMMVDLHRASNTYLDKIERNTRGGGGSGGGVVIHNRFDFSAKLTEAEYRDVVDVILDGVNAGLGTLRTQTTIRNGAVRR
jgi:tape measure domain-containing protein